MGNITLIAAIGKNRELGKNNGLIWHIPEDLRFFKNNTDGKYIVMGMNTLKSLPKMLPNRKHIVLTRQKVELDSQIIVFNNFDEALEYINKIPSEVMIIGGGQIYSLFIDYADKMLLTEIERVYDADVYFPEFNQADWDREVLSKNNFNDIEYSHVSYTRKRVKK